MTLDTGKINETYTIEKIDLPLKLEKRLEALGMTEGTSIPGSQCQEPGNADRQRQGNQVRPGKRDHKTDYGEVKEHERRLENWIYRKSELWKDNTF